MRRAYESSSSETDMKLWLPSVIIVMGAPIPYQIRKLKFENDAGVENYFVIIYFFPATMLLLFSSVFFSKQLLNIM